MNLTTVKGMALGQWAKWPPPCTVDKMVPIVTEQVGLKGGNVQKGSCC